MSDKLKTSAKDLVGSVLANVAKPSHHPPERELPVDEPGALASGEAAALVGSVLSKLGISDPAAADESAQAAAAEPVSDAEAELLIDIYFDLEEPLERDALLERIVTNRSAMVTDFLRAMADEDEDDDLRAAALAELCRRRVPEALALIEEEFAEPSDEGMFELAVRLLSEIRGVGFYDTLERVWQDAERDEDERRVAMEGMEFLDAERALTAFCSFVDRCVDIEAMQESQIETAMLAFARNDYREAVGPLEALCARIAAAALDEDERQELLEFVQEGIGLILQP